MGNISFNEISLSELQSNGFKLSPSLYKKARFSNPNMHSLRSILSGFSKEDKGSEVGSRNYINKSPKKFVRTKALDVDSFFLKLNTETTESILPLAFINQHLKQGDILISKDSNVGEVVILGKDYPDYMMSAGLNRLNISKNKLYVFGILKTEFFKNQLRQLASRGTTITHAKTLFLDCMIPFPNQDDSEIVINHVETLVRLVMAKESAIQQKMETINQLIEFELSNQKSGVTFNYKYPSLNDVIAGGRMDAGPYSHEFQEIEHIIKNYTNGYFSISPEKIKAGNTPKIRYISNELNDLPFNWVTPTHISDAGTINFVDRIRCENNNLVNNCLLLVNRTSRGGRGEYVGLGVFYDFNRYGAGHHNQGIYKIFGYDDVDLAYMAAFFNSNQMRKYCAGLTMGSKMKEIKSKHFINIPIPNFNQSQKEQIANLYHNREARYLDIQKIIYEGAARDIEAGIIQLTDDATQLKKGINEIVLKLVANERVTIG
jgi:type I restriction enzyme S subunit